MAKQSSKSSKTKSTKKSRPKLRKSPEVTSEVLPPDPAWLKKFSDPSSELPAPSREPSLSLTVRLFERESELKGAFTSEFAYQLGELRVCSHPDCEFRYVAEKGGSHNPTIRMLVHHYLHLIREAESRVVLGALNQVREILDPPKERVTSGLLEGGVLTEEEKRTLKLSKRDLRDL